MAFFFFAFCFIIVFTYLIDLSNKRTQIDVNEPPMVPFSLPIIGHTISYIFNAEKFLAKCRNKYGDPFNIFIFGNVLTYVGNKTSCEVFKEHDIFDHEQVLVETLIFPLAFKRIKGFGNMRFLANAVHEQVSGKIKVYVPRMQKELKNGIDLYIGNCKESKVIKNFADTMLFIIVRPIFNIIFGEEASHFEELIISMTTLLKQLGTLPLIPPVLSIIHPSLHIKAISWFLRFGWNPINKPKKLFTKLMKPIVKKRLLQKKKLDNEYIKKEDLMEYYLFDSDYDPNNVNDEYMEFLFEQLIVTLFAAFFTTVKVVTEALYEYAGRPELWKDIFEEQIMIYNKTNGNLTIDDVHKMVKLDSLLKETLRHSFPVVLKTTMSNESYTFSTGAKIPKGRVVVVYAADSHFNSQVYNDPESFQPNRYLTSNIDGSVVNYITATKLEKYYIPFGSGKHACPGRIFAVTEIKLCLYELILKYNIRTESGKVDPKLKIGDQLLPPITGLIFENR